MIRFASPNCPVPKLKEFKMTREKVEWKFDCCTDVFVKLIGWWPYDATIATFIDNERYLCEGEIDLSNFSSFALDLFIKAINCMDYYKVLVNSEINGYAEVSSPCPNLEVKWEVKNLEDKGKLLNNVYTITRSQSLKVTYSDKQEFSADQFSAKVVAFDIFENALVNGFYCKGELYPNEIYYQSDPNILTGELVHLD